MARTKKTNTVVNEKKVIGVTSGSHLTVTHYEDGTTDLKWDDAALLRDVQDAISSVSENRKVMYLDVGDLSPDEAVKLVKTVEKKVSAKRTSAKKKAK